MLLGKRCAISHWMGLAVPKKQGKCKSATISLLCGDSLSLSYIVWYWSLFSQTPLAHYILKFDLVTEEKEKVYFRSRYWNVPVLVNTGTFLVYQYCLKMWYLCSLEHIGVIQIQKLTILEHKNGIELSNTHIPVSGTWSILFPKRNLCRTGLPSLQDQCTRAPEATRMFWKLTAFEGRMSKSKGMGGNDLHMPFL